jgi:hypothetical protein
MTDRPIDPPAVAPYCARCRTDCTRQQPCAHCDNQRFPERHDLPADVLAAYERRVPGAREARLNDATAQYAYHLLRHWLEVSDAVMQDEGVDPRTRHRVLAAVAYASVSPADAWQRDRAQREGAQMLAGWPPDFTVPPELASGGSPDA